MESFSEDEDGDATVDKEGRTEQTSVSGKESDPSSAVAPAEIQNLLHRKEELERRHRKQERHRQRVQVGSRCLNPNATFLVKELLQEYSGNVFCLLVDGNVGFKQQHWPPSIGS